MPALCGPGCDGVRVWHNLGQCPAKGLPDQRKPLNEERLHELALFYVGKFATTRSKLKGYLNRKLRERGWEGDSPPEIRAARRADGLQRG